MDYIRYYFAPMVQILAAIGIYYGGYWAWIGIGSLPVLAVFDQLLPRDYRVRNISHGALAQIPIWLGALFAVGLYLLLAWRIGLGDMTTGEMIASTLSVAWLGVIVGVPSTHELYHQRGRLAQFVGIYSQVIYIDCTRNIAHMIGHHLDVGTPEDSDTANRGKSLYTFAIRAVFDSTIAANRMECEALVKRGMPRWGIQHRIWKAVVAELVFLAVLFSLGGLTAMAYGFGASVLARIWIETFNYFQHYGQVRIPGKPIARRHVWNHLGPISRLMAFEITNHADHHLNAYTPYYRLKPDDSAVELPSVFVCFLSALIPPLWNQLVIKPALKEWDLQHASAEERELARQQNIDAGWPDWFEADTQTV